MQGTVRWYSRQGFGFVDAVGSPAERGIYFHIADVKGRTILKPGDAVTFDVVQVPKGQKCINVVPVSAVDIAEVISCPKT